MHLTDEEIRKLAETDTSNTTIGALRFSLNVIDDA